MKKTAILILFLFCFLLSINNIHAEKWNKKGDLHKATILEWKKASYDNRLATSADFFVAITKNHNSKLQRKMDSIKTEKDYLKILKTYAIELEVCISDLVSGENWKDIFSTNTKIAEVCARCYKRLYGFD